MHQLWWLLPLLFTSLPSRGNNQNLFLPHESMARPHQIWLSNFRWHFDSDCLIKPNFRMLLWLCLCLCWRRFHFVSWWLDVDKSIFLLPGAFHVFVLRSNCKLPRQLSLPESRVFLGSAHRAFPAKMCLFRPDRAFLWRCDNQPRRFSSIHLGDTYTAVYCVLPRGLCGSTFSYCHDASPIQIAYKHTQYSVVSSQ